MGALLVCTAWPMYVLLWVPEQCKLFPGDICVLRDYTPWVCVLISVLIYCDTASALEGFGTASSYWPGCAGPELMPWARLPKKKKSSYREAWRNPPGFLRQTFMANGLCFNWLSPESLKGATEVNTVG